MPVLVEQRPRETRGQAISRIAVELLREHMGPGPHPNGSPQSVHGQRGDSKDNRQMDFNQRKKRKELEKLDSDTLRDLRANSTSVGNRRDAKKILKSRGEEIGKARIDSFRQKEKPGRTFVDPDEFRTVDPEDEENSNAIAKLLSDKGAEVIAKKESGSSYFRLPSGRQVRVSNHAPNAATLNWMQQNDVLDIRSNDYGGAISKLDTLNFLKQTNTRAFRRWFGDSKVVDENGKPLVVYRGGQAIDWNTGEIVSVLKRSIEFPSFDPNDSGVEIASFFTNDPDTADYFARFGADKHPDNAAIFPVYLSIKKPFVIDAHGQPAGTVQFGPSGQPFRDAIRSGKYDGVIIRDTSDEGDLFVALKPNQIKSATGNSGNFDPNSDDIREQSPGGHSHDQKE